MFLVTPNYKSDTTLMVNSSKGISAGDIAASFDLGSLNLSQKLVVTYGEIVKSRIVLEQVINRLELDMSYEGLLRKTTAQQVGSTEILRISVTDTDPDRAALIANTIADVFVKEVMRILKVNNVETIDTAIAMPNPVNVRLSLNIAISLILGLMIGVFAAFMLEYLDNTIKTPEDVEKYLGIPVLGSIPDVDQVAKR
jgi:capsular polysaccharide biosynthesis protein